MHVVVKVKQIVLLVVFVSVLAFTPVAQTHAQTNAQKEALNERIELLLAQVKKLQKQLALIQNKSAHSNPAAFSYKTKFYKGSYEALYIVEGDTLIPPSAASVRKGDKLLFDTFVDLVGEPFVKKYISEFRVYNTGKSTSAFVEEKPGDTWILGVNREEESLSEVYDDPSMVNLLIHEYGHIVFFNDTSIEAAFKKQFWGSKQAAGDFVTVYASTNATEDLAESFVHFVINEKPIAAGKKYDKIRFFYAYPELVKLRSQLRESDLI